MHTADLLRVKTLGTARRLRRVVAVLLKYGFGELVLRLGFKPNFFCRKTCRISMNLSPWGRLRRAMEELGPAAIKTGQLLSMRPDLVPQSLCDELKKLQEDVAEEPLAAVREVIEVAYGKLVEEVFDDFEAKPIAAASLSQVHKARRKDDGRVVAVKVRRPDVVATILADLDIMAYMAGLVHERVVSLRSAQLPDVVREIKKALKREIDFTNEARNMSIFNKLFAGDATIFAPVPHHDLCTESVVVMDFIEGARLDAFAGDDATRARLADAGLAACIRQMLTEGFFHADPHLGNLRVTPDNRLCFLDFGMVGRLTKEMRSALIDYIIATAKGDATVVAKVALEMAVKVPPLDFQRFTTDVMFALEKITGADPQTVNLGRFLLDLTQICREYGVFLRSDYILTARALLSMESAGRTLHPGVDMYAALERIGRDYAMKRLIPPLSDKPLFGDVEETIRTIAHLPKKVDDLLSLAKAGKLEFEVRQLDFGNIPASFSRGGNRVAGALVIASVVVGASLIFVSDIGPHWQGLPVFGLAGFLVSGLMALWLAAKMLTAER